MRSIVVWSLVVGCVTYWLQLYLLFMIPQKVLCAPLETSKLKSPIIVNGSWSQLGSMVSTELTNSTIAVVGRFVQSYNAKLGTVLAYYDIDSFKFISWIF